MNWDTNETIDVIINDQGLYLAAQTLTPEELPELVVTYAEAGGAFYADLNAVNWQEVTEYVR